MCFHQTATIKSKTLFCEGKTEPLPECSFPGRFRSARCRKQRWVSADQAQIRKTKCLDEVTEELSTAHEEDGKGRGKDAVKHQH